MRGTAFAAVAGLSVALAACGQVSTPQTPAMQAEDAIVVTQGATAQELSVVSTGVVRRMSALTGDTLTGSTRTQVSLSGCKGSTVPTTVNFYISGRQENDGSFNVMPNWTYNGSTWTSSGTSQKIEVAKRAAQDPLTVKTVNINVSVASDAADNVDAGLVQLPVAWTGAGSAPQAALAPETGSSYVDVTFTACNTPVTNNAPSIIVPTQPLVAEATSKDGSYVDFLGGTTPAVSGSDAEDGSLTPECSYDSNSQFPLGDTEVECTVTDSKGLTDTGTFTIRVVDTTAPDFTTFPSGPQTLPATDFNGVAFSKSLFTMAAADWNDVSSVTISCTPSDSTTTSPVVLDLGSKTTVSCTATDAYGNKSAARAFDLNIVFASTNPTLLQPINPDGSSAFKLGSTIPVKFLPPSYASKVADNLIENGNLTFTLTKLGAAPTYTELEAVDYSATGGTAWRYDATSGQYVFNLSSKSLTAGTKYKATVSYKGLTIAEGAFSIKK